MFSLLENLMLQKHRNISFANIGVSRLITDYFLSKPSYFIELRLGFTRNQLLIKLQRLNGFFWFFRP